MRPSGRRPVSKPANRSRPPPGMTLAGVLTPMARTADRPGLPLGTAGGLPPGPAGLGPRIGSSRRSPSPGRIRSSATRTDHGRRDVRPPTSAVSLGGPGLKRQRAAPSVWPPPSRWTCPARCWTSGWDRSVASSCGADGSSPSGWQGGYWVHLAPVRPVARVGSAAVQLCGNERPTCPGCPSPDPRSDSLRTDCKRLRHGSMVVRFRPTTPGGRSPDDDPSERRIIDRRSRKRSDGEPDRRLVVPTGAGRRDPDSGRGSSRVGRGFRRLHQLDGGPPDPSLAHAVVDAGDRYRPALSHAAGPVAVFR